MKNKIMMVYLISIINKTYLEFIRGFSSFESLQIIPIFEDLRICDAIFLKYYDLTKVDLTSSTVDAELNSNGMFLRSSVIFQIFYSQAETIS